MAVNLQKGQKINLQKDNGSKLERFCVGCNWGAIQTKGFLGIGKKITDVDLDLSCVLFDNAGQMCDHLYSPFYKPEFLARYGMPNGKLDSKCGALHHTGDDRSGDTGGDDGLDNEIITVDLTRIGANVNKIFFFLNNCGTEDFSQIPYAAIRMYEGTPERVINIFAQYNVVSNTAFAGKTALIMASLYKHNGEWKFSAIGDAFADRNLCETIGRIKNSYVN